MTEIGDSVDRVDALIKETKTFHGLCESDIERAEEVLSIGMSFDLLLYYVETTSHVLRVISTEVVDSVATLFMKCLDLSNHLMKKISGHQLISVRGACPKEMVQPKCDELFRVCEILTERLMKRLENLTKNRDLMERVEKASNSLLIG